MLPPELMPFLAANTARLRRLGLAATIGFALLLVPAIALAVHAFVADIPQWILSSCHGDENCLAGHRWDELSKALIFGALVLAPLVIGLVVFLRNRTPLSTPLAKALVQGGDGLRAVYPRKTRVTAVGMSIGHFYEIVFERDRGGDPWTWIVRAEQVDGIMSALRRIMPNVPTEPSPW